MEDVGGPDLEEGEEVEFDTEGPARDERRPAVTSTQRPAPRSSGASPPSGGAVVRSVGARRRAGHGVAKRRFSQ